MSEYYIISRANNNNHPLFEWDQLSGMFYKGRPVEISEPVKLRLGSPVPKKPEMVDYHSLPESVVSEKIKDVLEAMNIDGIQLVPVKIQGKNEGEFYDYWLMHIYKKIPCMDWKKSDYKVSESGRLSVRKLVIDEAVVKDIPLEKRLVFELKEGASLFLVHKSVRNSVMAVNPDGVEFIDVDEWGIGSSFG